MFLARRHSRNIGFDLPCEPEQLSLKALWRWHQMGQTLYRQKSEQEGAFHWLEIKRALAWKLLQKCDFCVHDCQVNRSEGASGYCRLGAESPVSGSYLHWGEERPIRPTWAVFFSGCTMHCVYCHNWRETFDFSAGMKLDIDSLLQDLSENQGGYRSLSLIGGTPEPHLHTILDLVLALPSEIQVPLVFNNNATLSQVGLALMEGVVDIYVPDFKHGNDNCAWQLTKIQNYLGAFRMNLEAYLAQKAAILIRHLVIPGHLECCTRPILEIIAQNYPTVMLNVMFQYRPMYQAESLPVINRILSTAEESRVIQWIDELDLKVLT